MSRVSGSSSTLEVHRRIGLANSIVGQLDRVWRNRRLSLNTKLRLYTSLVQSVLLHGSETWTLTKADTAQLQAFHMKAQRRILDIKWYDFVTNDSVQSQTKLMDLPLTIADRRHSLLGHVCRLPPDVPAHNILQHCVNISCRADALPRLEASTWSAKEDLDTTGGRGSRVHNQLAVVIGAGSLVVEVATAVTGQAQQ